ncbi:hypothetical protein C5167_022881 [Papaver somniferum]|uniref:Uncharacterized protein n=1 Tax=Papaver somniferum TaxID=3469 RepID=A0A4Y7JKN6_PAPSO|nr:hypothetical protein C5167_022881 [Papaver somniferum]
MKEIRRRKHTSEGTNNRFWEGIWIEDGTLKSNFLLSFPCDKGNNKDSTVCNMRAMNNGKLEWNLNISRRVHNNVIEEISGLLPKLSWNGNKNLGRGKRSSITAISLLCNCVFRLKS